VSAVSAPEDCSPHMSIEQLVDCLRDLVRRSILMRLLLNKDDRWPLGGDPPPADQLWTGTRFRTAVARRMAPSCRRPRCSYAARPAPPLCDSIFHDYPGQGPLTMAQVEHPRPGKPQTGKISGVSERYAAPCAMSQTSCRTVVLARGRDAVAPERQL
jgi:hypothetical protein